MNTPISRWKWLVDRTVREQEIVDDDVAATITSLTLIRGAESGRFVDAGWLFGTALRCSLRTSAGIPCNRTNYLTYWCGGWALFQTGN